LSVQAISWALSQQTVTAAAARHVLLCLANYAGEDGRNAFPSIQRLCKDTGLSERAVRNNLRDLESLGVIRRGNQAVAAAFIERADRRPTVYDMPMQQEERGAADAAREATGGISRPNGGHLVPERGAGGAPEPSYNHQKNLLGEPEVEKVDEIGQALAEYQRIAEQVGLPKVAKLTDKRKSHLRERLADFGLAGWIGALRSIPSSWLLTGQGDRGWKPDFDWLVNPTNLAKVIEGKYAGKGGVAGANGPRPAAPGEYQARDPADFDREDWRIRIAQQRTKGLWSELWRRPPPPDMPINEAVALKFEEFRRRAA
jgi:DNA-binding Lrp family transcriptional regulator